MPTASLSIWQRIIAIIRRWISRSPTAPAVCVAPSGTPKAPTAPGKIEKIDQAGIALIKSFESCDLKSYQDQHGIWTIGWGHTNGVGPNQTCTQEQADAWFLEDLLETEHYLNRVLPMTLNDNQYSALVSLTYNIGIGRLYTSTLLKEIKAGNLSAASDQFLVWDKVKGVADDGLLRRRKAEQALFNIPV